MVFARGRLESPGPGVLGNAFINALSSKVGGRSFGSYAVRYPADTQVDIGANDMSQHVQYMINNCPDTRLVWWLLVRRGRHRRGARSAYLRVRL